MTTLVLLGQAAAGATLTVGAGEMYPTIGDAVLAAAAWDTIEIHTGTYRETVTASVPLRVEGVGWPVFEAAGQPGRGIALALEDGGIVRGIVFQGRGNRQCLGAGRRPPALPSTLVVRDSVFLQCASALGPNTGSHLWADRVVVRGGRGLYANESGALHLSRSAFVGCDRAIEVYDAASFTLENSIVSGNVDGVVIDVTGTANTIRGNRFCGNSGFAGPAINLWNDPPSQPDVLIEDNLFDGNVASNSGGAIATSGSQFASAVPQLFVHIARNTFVGNSAPVQGAAVYNYSATEIDLNSNLFVWNTGSSTIRSQSGAPVVGDWNLFFGNDQDLDPPNVTSADMGSSLFGVDPMLTSVTVDDLCSNDDLTPLAGSPVIDGGDPLLTDLDGSRADIGWTGY